MLHSIFQKEMLGTSMFREMFSDADEGPDIGLYLIKDGAVPPYALYTRLLPAWGEFPDGSIAEFPTDYSPFEYVTTGGTTNLVLTNGIPVEGNYDGMTLTGTGATLTQEVLADGLRYYKLTTSASSAATVEFAGATGTTDDCAFSVWGASSNFSGAILKTSDGSVALFDTGTPQRLSGIKTPSSVNVKMSIEGSSNTVTYFRLPQITVGSELEDDIPSSSSGPVSVGSSTTKRFRQYEGTNKIEADGDPTTFTDGVVLGGALSGFPEIVNIGGLNYYHIDNRAEVLRSFATLTGDPDNNTEIHTISVTVIGNGSIHFSAEYGIQRELFSTTTPINVSLSKIPLSTTSSMVVSVEAGDEAFIRLTQFTKTTYQLPVIISSRLGPVTVNAGTTSLLAEDIVDASYLLKPTEKDYVVFDSPLNLGKNHTIIINTLIDTAAPQQLIGDVNGIVVTSSEIYYNVNNVGHMVSATGISGVEVEIKITRIEQSLEFFINNTSIGTANISAVNNVDLIIEEMFRRKSIDSRYVDGYVWDIQFKDGSDNFIEHYKLSEYREDTFVRGEYGNHGTASRSVDNLIQENQGFGYPVNQSARTPWQYTTDDGVVVQKGLREFFGGEARGVNGLNGSVVGANISKVGHIYTVDVGGTSNDNRITFTILAVPIDTKIEYDLLFTVGGLLQVWNGTTYETVGTYGDGSRVQVYAYQSSVTQSPIRLFTQGCVVEILSIREVSPAVGVIPFTAYIPHALTADMPLIQFQDSDFVALKVEATTGLIKGTDGTNTCVSASALVAGTEYSGWFAFNGDEMWITLEGVKGTIVTFAGYFPDIGNRVFGLTNGTYQTIRHLYFENKLFFEYVFHNGEQVFHNGEPVIVYT